MSKWALTPKFALSPKVAEALGLGIWASEQDAVARIQRVNDQIVDGAIASGRLAPGLREWARSNFSAFGELVKNIPTGGLAQLARNRAVETGEPLAEAQQAVVRQNPELYNARTSVRVVDDHDRRRQSIRHAASGQLATLVKIERERQGCGYDEAARIAFEKHPALVRQYQTGQVDGGGTSVVPDSAVSPVLDEGPSLEDQIVGVRKALGLAPGASWAQIQSALLSLTSNPNGGTSRVPQS